MSHKVNKDENKHIGRPSKEEKYGDERKKMLIALNKILGITINNNIFYLCDIDDKKQKKIEDMKDNIEKFFKINSTTAFKEKVDREYLALIKVIYSGMKISMTHTTKTVTRGEDKKITGCYLVGALKKG